MRRGLPPSPLDQGGNHEPTEIREIIQENMGGWVRVFLGRGEPTGEVAKFLSHSLTEWMRQRPHLRVRFAVPINRDGDTVELHAWYDQIIFPDISPPMANPEQGGAKE